MTVSEPVHKESHDPEMTVRSTQPASGRKRRILHVIGGMDRGGTETWLMHVLRAVDRSELQMEFVVHADHRCAYDDEIEALGSRIHVCRSPRNPLQYAHDFRNVIQTHGPFDVVHSHQHHFSGLVLWLASALGVPERIAHSHNDTSDVDSTSSIGRKAYLRAGERLIQRYATAKLAASVRAAGSLYGMNWQGDGRVKVLYCGLDFNAFTQSVDPAEVRQELNLTSDDFVVGHVGRFTEQKNHYFLLRVYQEVLKLESRAKLLLVGKGPLESAIRQTAQDMGIMHGIRFAGVRPDVPRIMLGGMDVFVFPSLYEGLGLVAVEAQAAGLPTRVSSQVPWEADLGCGLLEHIALTQSPETWARLVLQSTHQKRVNKVCALAAATNSRFNLASNLAALRALYDT